MIIIDFENAASHKYVVQRTKSCEWLNQK